MSRHDQSSKRDLKKEAFWREAFAQYQKSGLNQAEFCRREGLNPQRFSGWKGLIAERDLEQARKITSNNEKQENLRTGIKASMQKKKPAFVKLQIDPGEELQFGEAHKSNTKLLPCSHNHQVIAAELTAPAGCQVRVFNGADPSTISALLQALASCW